MKCGSTITPPFYSVFRPDSVNSHFYSTLHSKAMKKEFEDQLSPTKHSHFDSFSVFVTGLQLNTGHFCTKFYIWWNRTKSFLTSVAVNSVAYHQKDTWFILFETGSRNSPFPCQTSVTVLPMTFPWTSSLAPTRLIISMLITFRSIVLFSLLNV